MNQRALHPARLAYTPARRNPPMRMLSTCLLVVLATALAGQAMAEEKLDHNRFKWRDAQGNLHYSDTLPGDAARLGYEVVNPQGIVVRRVERAKTPAELAAAKRAAAAAQDQRDADAALARADAQLLGGYPEESDLRRAQQQKIEVLEQQITAAQVSLRNQEQSLAGLLGRAADSERTGKPLPAEQATELARMRHQVDQQRLAVERRQRERDLAEQRFAGEIDHYRALKAGKSR
jgi:hypothetical protein